MAAIADPFVPWFDLWKQSAQLAAGLTPLAAPRLELFGVPSVWMPSALIESQQMLCERMVTVGEMWWTLWLGTCSPAALLSTRGWDGQDRRAQERRPGSVEAPTSPSPVQGDKLVRHG